MTVSGPQWRPDEVPEHLALPDLPPPPPPASSSAVPPPPPPPPPPAAPHPSPSFGVQGVPPAAPGGQAGPGAVGPQPVPHDGPGGADQLTWRRFHPITPAIKGWKILVGVLVVVGMQFAENVQTAARVIEAGGLLGLFGLIVVVTAIGGGYAFLAWRMATFAVDEQGVYLRTGVLFRQHRTARLDRLQAIDVIQPLLARLTGLAELKVEVAGGADSAVRLSFLRESDAQVLRNEILAMAAGLAVRRGAAPAVVPGAGVAVGASGSGIPGMPGGPGPVGVPGAVAAAGSAAGTHVDAGVPGAAVPGAPAPGVVPEAPEREVFSVPAPLLLGSLARSGAVLVSVVLVIALIVLMAVVRQPGILVSVLPGGLAVIAFLWQRFAGEFGFRAALSPDGIRLRHGLLESRAQTVPPGRVQAVRLSQGPLWRGKDWWRVQMNVAGYGISTDQTVESVLLPVGSREDALLALWLVVPDLGTEDPRALLDAALVGSNADRGFRTCPRGARWLDPLTWRRNGFAVTDRALVIRRGRIVRSTVIVPHERTQSLAMSQGPIERGLRLADVVVHSTPGPAVPVVRHLDQDIAALLLHEQAARARRARAAAGPEQWMTELRAQQGAAPS